MRQRGFTLLELVIVLVLIGITALLGTRFIAGMAGGYMAAAERSQGLASARFALERLKRELGLAYSPSVYLNDDHRCLSFVPVLAAGRYRGQVMNGSADFVMPLVLQGQAMAGIDLAVRADSGEAAWEDYPTVAPANVFALADQEPVPVVLPFADAFPAPAHFVREGAGERYTLLHRRQVRYCIDGGEVRRSERGEEGWGPAEPMLTQVTTDSAFSDYYESIQLLGLALSVQGRDGRLVLPSQIQVGYEP
ncbi:mannose-sensitive agglutinin biogenesis protein MshO [Zobellella endophytica]|uniref:Mannose-sensitive agglutinin biogenesis protein MshO n=1 Tax=Zobellella endophytica TaxID=2116700 RepID=A0A2P7RC03_9GAMM|nr:prepilin-type N-terminal cleavage/methylation domain-containing protein [Zobellella endophytica]PSJ47766.1 mannose-sensitive agglutinin biogenesis protein MshO [Zobellella endophytica]